ncbi:hypothetical protein U91I_00252 [alpha proteobacterium U9-1i]|nr:hypothetical protein U91I_00252 [alpha proteobacterium U9-1i]
MQNALGVLTKDMIQKRRLIRDQAHTPANDARYEPTAVNLTIGAFLPADRATGNHLRLNPQEMVCVLSREVIWMPGDVTGHIAGKRQLASKGIMAINTGMIDPAFRGPISVILVNFSDRPQDLEIGTEFLKVIFHAHELSVDDPAELDETGLKTVIDDFSAKREREARQFARTFLNFDGHAQEMQKVVGERIVQTAVIQATIAAAVLAVLAIFLPIGVQLMRDDSHANAQTNAQLREDVEALQLQLAVLRAEQSQPAD